MMKINPMLLIDFYKSTHDLMLPKGMTKSVSYFTPRQSRIEGWNEVIMFGLQGFIQEYLIDYFNENFFNCPWESVYSEYTHVLDNALGKDGVAYDSGKIKKLHDLGYLPIEIVALPEGTIVPIHVPLFGITNTHPDFAWLPQALESLISVEFWKMPLIARVAYEYRKIVNEWYDKTCDDDIPRARALGNFDFRGDDMSVHSAIKTGAAWCTSFLNTATVPTIPYLEYMYNCDCSIVPVGFGSPSTEHAVMCSNFAVDGDEITLLRRLLTEIYPNTSFTAVLDSYDYWNVIDNILPQLHDEIMAHNGTFIPRGDSGDPVTVVTKTVYKLWEQFGGTINSKGYKVLDPHVKAIYGDSITLPRAREIYSVLAANGFAACNVSLGVGSFSMQCIEQFAPNGARTLKPFTRDTFGMAIKATYCEIDGKPTPIFKNPKESTFKKSQKGCVVVCEALDRRSITYVDGYSWDKACSDKRNLLRPVFRDGLFLHRDNLTEIRNRLHEGKF